MTILNALRPANYAEQERWTRMRQDLAEDRANWAPGEGWSTLRHDVTMAWLTG